MHLTYYRDSIILVRLCGVMFFDKKRAGPKKELFGDPGTTWSRLVREGDSPKKYEIARRTQIVRAELYVDLIAGQGIGQI